MEYLRIKRSECPHSAEIRVTASEQAKCSQCEATQHLRQCTSCGGVFCCESDRAHNTEHFKQTGHPIIKSHGTPYDFLWCYQCNAYLE
ncbi:MAG: Na+/H+ antiporter [Parcubacteria group bacterium Gr01-1014_38]|nr:MAG: Na+/H+ antiporter [Parcubacteria group bacterium Gr01-1014_38]